MQAEEILKVVTCRFYKKSGLNCDNLKTFDMELWVCLDDEL